MVIHNDQQPGAYPIDIPEEVPNPAYPEEKPALPVPVTPEPVRVPEKVD